MQTLRSSQQPNGPPKTVLVSAILHACLLFALLGTFHFASRRAPFRLPGTPAGIRYLSFYAPGSRQHAVGQVVVKEQAIPPTISSIPAPSIPRPAAATAAPAADPGAQSSIQSGLGEGKINIALQKVFPYPTPSLASLPHGTRGDVILNAVIDEHGNIAELTLIQGLGPAIDDSVIATVRQWSYTPATRDGVPVASEQELHFHYERG